MLLLYAFIFIEPTESTGEGDVSTVDSDSDEVVEAEADEITKRIENDLLSQLAVLLAKAVIQERTNTIRKELEGESPAA